MPVDMIDQEETEELIAHRAGGETRRRVMKRLNPGLTEREVGPGTESQITQSENFCQTIDTRGHQGPGSSPGAHQNHLSIPF